MTWFRVWIEIYLFSVSGRIEIDLFLDWGSKLTVESINLAFVLGIEIDLILVWGSKLTFFYAGVKIVLFFLGGWSKATYFVQSRMGRREQSRVDTLIQQ